jgi:predicted phage terminase large subunit-like protein
VQLTDEDWLAIEREECKTSLAYFVKRAWKSLEPSQPYSHGWHIDALSEHLEAVTAGQITRLLINIPPGTMKSMLTGVMWPAWEWGAMGRPSTRIIGASHEAKLATRDNLNTRRLITSEWYQALWPMALTTDQNEKTFFQNEEMGWRQSCAVTAMTGRRGDRVIWDDPHSVEDAHSPAALETATRVFRETLPTRLNNPDSSTIIIIMQRLNEKDVSGEILRGDFGYEHLMLPMEFEPGRKCKTSIGFTDPRTEEGELLFPARFSRETVERDKKIMGAYATAGQFQQRPSALGGTIFKESWWQYYRIPPAIEHRSIYADTAQKTKEHNDYSVFQCWGRSINGQAVLLDQIRGKWEAPELLAQARAFWRKHQAGQGTLRAVKIEDKASGTGLIQSLKREGCPVVAIPRNTDKIMRAMDAAPFVEAGQVLLPKDAPWLSEFLTEAASFPKGAHDDQLDPMMDAVADILGGVGKSDILMDFI